MPRTSSVVATRRSRVPRSHAVRAVASACLLAGGVLALSGGPPRHGSPRFELQPQVIALTSERSGKPPTTAFCRAASHGTSACYEPFQVRDAYDLAPLYARGINGSGVTIAIVDPFGSPTIRSDLTAFDKAFSLPAPPSFRIIAPVGAIPAYSSKVKYRFGWASETSLDVEWAHALAPRASILLVETPTNEVEGTTGFPDIVAAENYVLRDDLASIISQSFGATEQTFDGFAELSPLRAAFVTADADDVTVLGASGDLGATDLEYNAVTIYPFRVTGWPASDPLVTAVGGTKLDLSGTGATLRAAVAWNDTYTNAHPFPDASGGGKSIYFSRPAYQSAVASVTGPHRGVPDVAMSAACTGAVDTYVGVKGPKFSPGWLPACGTSESTPLFAAIVALADQDAGHSLGLLNPSLYGMRLEHDSGLVPVTSGNNTVEFTSSGSHRVTVQGYNTRAGYSLVTGLGTIDADEFVPALVAESNRLSGAIRGTARHRAPPRSRGSPSSG